MRTEDLRRLAVECDLDPHDLCEDPRIALHNLERFATLVAKHEREACIEACEASYHGFNGPEGWLKYAVEAIRARQ